MHENVSTMQREKYLMASSIPAAKRRSWWLAFHKSRPGSCRKPAKVLAGLGSSPLGGTSCRPARPQLTSYNCWQATTVFSLCSVGEIIGQWPYSILFPCRVAFCASSWLSLLFSFRYFFSFFKKRKNIFSCWSMLALYQGGITQELMHIFYCSMLPLRSPRCTGLIARANCDAFLVFRFFLLSSMLRTQDAGNSNAVSLLLAQRKSFV